MDDVMQKIQAAKSAMDNDPTPDEMEESTPPQEQAEDDAQKTDDPTPIEEKARSQGWKPEDQFIADGGDPEKWKPAKQFVEYGELLSSLRDLKKTVKKYSSVVDAMHEERKIIAENSYKKALQDLQARRTEAAANDDIKGVVQASEQIEQLQQNPPKDLEIKEEKPQGPSEEDLTLMRAWQRQNPWYTEDPELGAYADALGNRIMTQQPEMPIEEVLARVERSTRLAFPRKFSNPRKQVASPVVGDQQTGSEAHGGQRLPRVLQPQELASVDPKLFDLYNHYKRNGMFKENKDSKKGSWTYEDWARKSGLVEGLKADD